MIYKFKSKAAADLIMLGPQGDRVLSLIGKTPSAQGIIEPTQFPAAIAALQSAIAEDEARRAEARAEHPDDAEALDGAVSLRQRAFPMVEMMQRCLEAKEPIVWGV